MIWTGQLPLQTITFDCGHDPNFLCLFKYGEVLNVVVHLIVAKYPEKINIRLCDVCKSPDKDSDSPSWWFGLQHC